jgi:hypothetical protein
LGFLKTINSHCTNTKWIYLIEGNNAFTVRTVWENNRQTQRIHGESLQTERRSTIEHTSRSQWLPSAHKKLDNSHDWHAALFFASLCNIQSNDDDSPCIYITSNQMRFEDFHDVLEFSLTSGIFVTFRYDLKWRRNWFTAWRKQKRNESVL